MTAGHKATLAYVAPFAAYVVLMQAERALSLPGQIAYPIRLLIVALVLVFRSRKVMPPRPSFPLWSVAVGVAVFLVWIGPDVLFGPAWRHFALFENRLTGSAATSLSPVLLQSIPFLAIRIAGSAVLVPIVEELFWRGWLMRWLIHTEFMSVPIGQYAPAALWVTAALFAAEHGSYWEVGLAAGIVYNWWVIRSKNLADAMLAHAVTNGLLAAYVLLFGQWQYWL